MILDSFDIPPDDCAYPLPVRGGYFSRLFDWIKAK
jgi:hypothetical protein